MLNTGIAEAKGDMLAFMNDDVEIEPNWLQNMPVPLRDVGVAG